MRRSLWRLLNRVVAVSDAVLISHMKQWKIPRHRIVVIRNGVALPAERGTAPADSKHARPLQVPEDVKIVLNVGNLTRQKAQYIFVEAAAQVLEHFPNALFLIIGEGEERSRLAQLIEEKSVGEKVKLLGSRTDVTSILGRSSLLVLSSLWEGLPLTILEAMAAGRPVVVTDVGGNKEAVRNGETGYIVPNLRPDLLADHILKVLNDDALAERMGTKGKLLYESKFRAERQVKETEDLYGMLLRARRKEVVAEGPALETDRRRAIRAQRTAVARRSQRLKVVYVMGTGIMVSGGGAERQLIELLKGIDKNRYTPVVCTMFPPYMARLERGSNWHAIRSLGVRIYELPKRTKPGPITLYRLYGIMRRERPDIVHAYSFLANWRATIAAVCARVPVVICSDRNVNNWMKWHHCLFERLLTRFRKANVVNAVALKKFLAEREGIPVETIRVIYNGVDLRRFETAADVGEVKRELGIPPQAPVVGLVAVLSDKKDIPTFLRAAVRVKEVIPDTTFLIVGDGPARFELEDLALELGLGDSARFIGHSNAVPRFISAMNISVLSSLREGCSNAILESMAMGKPVVATDVGGNRELVDNGDTGFLVSTSDDEALAEKIVYLLNNPGIANEMGQAGREKTRRLFSVSRMVQETVFLYESFAPCLDGNER